MKPFSFRFEKILGFRVHSENEAKIELGRAISALADIENRIRLLGQERVRAAAEQYSPGNNIVQIQQYMYYLLRIDAAIEQLQKEAVAAEMKVEEAREAFLEASKERKVLDKLREKRLKEYKKEFFAEETKTLDDISGGARLLAAYNDLPDS